MRAGGLARAALALASVVVGASASCAARPPQRGAPSSSTIASASPVAPPCRALDATTLAPRARVQTNEVVRLGDVAPPADARPRTPRDRAAPFSANLGTVSYTVSLSDIPPRRHLYRVRDLPSRAWFGPDGIRASVLTHLDKITSDAKREADADRLVRLLAREQRLVTHDRLEHTGPTRSSDDFAREDACLSEAYEDANRARSAGFSGRYAAEDALVDALGPLEDRSPDEDILFAWVTLQHTTRMDPQNESAIADARARLVAIADDANRPAATRVHVSRAILDDLRLDWLQPDKLPHLERIVSLGEDPAFVLPARAELAYLDRKDPTSAASLEEIRAAIVAAGPFVGARPLLLEVDHEIGRAHERLRDPAAAIRAYARCLDDAAPDMREDDDLEPAACTLSLRWAIRQEGGVPTAAADTTIPRVFAGYVGAELAIDAIHVLDRDLAGASARFAVDRAYDAAEAPLALTLLARLTASDSERKALLDQRARDFGRTSAWWRRESRVGAATADERHVAALLDPDLQIPAEPTTEDEWRVELRDVRAKDVPGECNRALIDEGAKLTVRVDTKGAVPTVKVTTDRPAPRSVPCVEDAVRLHFRSVPPAALTLVLVP